MSRHISGELAAMRVKSRKPLAAKRKTSSASGRAANSSTSANASRCGRCDTAAKIRSCAPASSVRTRAPQVCPERGDRRDRARIGFRQRRQHDVAVAIERREGGGGAGVLGARDRMPGHEARQRGAERRARRGDHVLLGAAGVGDDRARPEVRRHRREQRRILRDRRGEQHDVGVASSRVQSSSSVTQRSMMPRRRAASRLARPRPTPTTVADSAGRPQRERERAADQADADDDELVDAGRAGALIAAGASARASAGKRRLERIEEAAVLGGQADRHAQVLGQPVIGDRTHDDALLEQPLIDATARRPP